MASATAYIHNVVLTSFPTLKFSLSLVVKFVLVIVCLCLLKLHIPKDGRYVLRYGYKMTKYYSSEFSFSIFECFVVDTGSCMHMQ